VTRAQAKPDQATTTHKKSGKPTTPPCDHRHIIGWPPSSFALKATLGRHPVTKFWKHITHAMNSHTKIGGYIYQLNTQTIQIITSHITADSDTDA